MNHFTFRTNHNLLEWLVTISNAYGRQGGWINTLQDFSFKIQHIIISQHTNVDVLSCNPVDSTKENEDM